MRVLVLGATGFLGRHLVESLLALDIQPTLVHRGRLEPGEGALFPAWEHRIGAREDGLRLGPGDTWDAVVDTCGYLPGVVRRGAEELRGRVGRYLYVSSVSAYADLAPRGLTEDAPLQRLEDPRAAELRGVRPETYGGLKALCEQVVTEAFPGRAMIVRPGLIVGPYDGSDRFSYWVARVARGGRILAPPKDEPIQFLDVRDLAQWMAGLVRSGATGIVHASGPREPRRLGEVLAACRTPGCEAELVHVDGEWLVSQGVRPWSDLPLWVHARKLHGTFYLDPSRALASGLSHRPLEETIADTRTFLASRDERHTWRAGLPPSREARLLAAWDCWRGSRPTS